jgi:hypothetical protein
MVNGQMQVTLGRGHGSGPQSRRRSFANLHDKQPFVTIIKHRDRHSLFQLTFTSPIHQNRARFWYAFPFKSYHSTIDRLEWACGS